MLKESKICARGLWDGTIPGILFDENGVSNYAKIQDELCRLFQRGEKGIKEWEQIVDKIKTRGKNQKYDCIIGVSGGTDSSFLLHLTKRVYGLRPLAFNLDNGWNSDISVNNIKKVTKALGIDLETYVIEYEEIKDLLKVFMEAGLPWIDNPTDLAIQSAIFKIAVREKIGYILFGNDFRSEGKQPTEWTYCDQKQLRYLHRNFGEVKLKTYPIISIWKYLFLSFIKGIKVYYPYNYIEYDKQTAQKIIKAEYDWAYYGEHHYENFFTKWAIGFWMYEKFKIDKRIITYSAQILNGAISREEAMNIISKKPFTDEKAKSDTEYILKKLNYTKEEFLKIWNSPNKSFLDYPSYYSTLKKHTKFISWFMATFLKINPKIIVEMGERK